MVSRSSRSSAPRPRAVSLRNSKTRVGGRRRRSTGPGRRHRSRGQHRGAPFDAPEVWHEPDCDVESPRFVVQPSGQGYIHPVSVEEVQDRLKQLPSRFVSRLHVIQFSRMTRKRALFPCYGLQWGPNVYLYPIEENLIERFARPPRPEQQVEARMFGARWERSGSVWELIWTPQAIRDFYLNNVLIHEIGHVNDSRNRNFHARERFANWFANEYGYRASRRRR